MYYLEFYQMPKSKRWRWKVSYNKSILARSDYHYSSKAAANKSFVAFKKAMQGELILK